MTISLSVTGDELLPVVLLVEQRFELDLETSSVDIHDEGKVGATPGRVVGILDYCYDKRFSVMHQI